MHQCPACQKLFEQNINGDKKFCSKDCKRLYHNRQKIGLSVDVVTREQKLKEELPPAGTIINCPTCLKEFTKKRYWQKFCCYKCLDTARRREKNGLPPNAKTRYTKTPEERFWEKVNKHGPIPGHCSELGKCWIWIACKDKGGYGCFTESKKGGKTSWSGGSHVYSYFLEHKKMPEKGQFVCHACDNRLCVNPKHLWLGSRSDNIKDCVDKNRFSNGKISFKALKRGNLSQYTENELYEAAAFILNEIYQRK